jgi:hypothetical protein
MKQVSHSAEAGEVNKEQFVLLASILSKEVAGRVVFEMIIMLVIAPLIALQLVRWFAKNPEWDPVALAAVRMPYVGVLISRSPVIMRFLTTMLSNTIANKIMSIVGKLYFDRRERENNAELEKKETNRGDPCQC